MENQNDMPRGLSRENTTFETQFSRARNTLYLLACEILSDSRLAHHVVEHCRIICSQQRVMFNPSGAFHSWLLRLAINEALFMLELRRKGDVFCHEAKQHIDACA
jgi:DNA-directed RNA polymerase specialized sigma24 family protein